MKRAIANEPVSIESFIKSILAVNGLKRVRDYTLRRSQLHINKMPIRGKLLGALREEYPEYNYYWETPKILRWF